MLIGKCQRNVCCFPSKKEYIDKLVPLETVQLNILRMANLLIYQKVLDIGSLISTQLNDLAHFLILLHGTVARKVLFKGFANTLNVQVVGKARHGSNTLTTVSLLHSDMDLFFRRNAPLVPRVLERVLSILENKKEN
jgi:hypothetical protein